MAAASKGLQRACGREPEPWGVGDRRRRRRAGLELTILWRPLRRAVHWHPFARVGEIDDRKQRCVCLASMPRIAGFAQSTICSAALLSGSAPSGLSTVTETSHDGAIYDYTTPLFPILSATSMHVLPVENMVLGAVTQCILL